MNRLQFSLLTAALMLGIPLAASQSPVHTATPPAMPDSAVVYRVLQTETNTVTEIPLREYLMGAVGAEMPATYETEALKAQAVAAHTYAEYMRQRHQQQPDASLQGADFSDDSSHYQAYATLPQLQALYGEQWQQYEEKLAAAVDAVMPEILCYDEQPIAAAFHAVSAGETEAARDVWGQDLPYLISVPSAADSRSPQYTETRVLPAETVRKVLAGIALPDNPATWFGQPETTPTGTVLHIPCGSTLLTGQALRDALALHSACFTVSYADGQFTFITKGYGHGVGMSQYGANAMAQAGKDYRSILAHYYPDTVLTATC